MSPVYQYADLTPNLAAALRALTEVGSNDVVRGGHDAIEVDWGGQHIHHGSYPSFIVALAMFDESLAEFRFLPAPTTSGAWSRRASSRA